MFLGAGDFVAVAANGDELHGSYANRGCAEQIPVVGTAIEGTQTIAGGTGRFQNAAGSTTTVGSALGDVFELTARGTISY